mmetsp:Transcript_11502/g.27769  ORF Transcript_11502/g.27769 Transcript_11502/m.27769 type:complete len:143 (-) Transcript_11502:151-579(-)
MAIKRTNTHTHSHRPVAFIERPTPDRPPHKRGTNAEKSRCIWHTETQKTFSTPQKNCHAHETDSCPRKKRSFASTIDRKNRFHMQADRAHTHTHTSALTVLCATTETVRAEWATQRTLTHPQPTGNQTDDRKTTHRQMARPT